MSNRKPDILFIASWYPTSYKPFNGDFIQRHARAVAGFCNVTVIHVDSAEQKEPFVVHDRQNEKVREIIVFHKKIKEGWGVLRPLLNLYKKLSAFKLALRKAGKPDAAHLNVLFPGAVFALYLKWKHNVPFIVTEHWTKFLPSSKASFGFLEKRIIKTAVSAAGYVCPVSKDLMNNMVKQGFKGNYKVIPNVVDTNVFYPDFGNREETDTFRYIHVSGMLDKHKNISGMLRAFINAYSRQPDIRLTFVGGDDVEKYRKIVKDAGIPEGVITFAGVVPYAKVAEYLRRHDALLMFSNYENLPCVISEALVCGLPVLSSNVGGIAEMLNDSNGILVEKQNENELADKIVYMAKNRHLYDKKSIADEAKNVYSYDAVGKQYSELYRQILRR